MPCPDASSSGYERDLQRLNEALSYIHQVREICQVPSITFEVFHQGEVILFRSIGYRDVEGRLDANPDTIHMIGSCFKMFISAAMGILVVGEVKWQEPISKYLPEFNPEGDPRIGHSADIIDVIPHSTGLTTPHPLCVGPRGTIFMGTKNLVPLLNMMPNANDEGQTFNRH